MAFTRKKLKAYGLTDEQIEQVMDDHIEVVDSLKAAAKAPEDDPEGDTAAKDKKSHTKESEWEKKYNDLVAENAKKEETAKKENALKALLSSEESHLSEAGRAKALKYASLDEIELDSAGKIKGSKKLLDAFHEEWKEYITESKDKGADTSGKDGAGAGGGNGNGGSSGKMTKEDIMKIKDASKRQEAIAENHELFGF